MSTLSVSSTKDNSLSIPPGKYGRKAKTQRNRRGLTQTVDHVAQFDNKRRTLPGFEIPTKFRGNAERPQGGGTGAAWLSSACAVRRTLKWGNMRNPRSMFYMSWRTARDNWEEGGDDAKSARPFDTLGRTHDTMGLTMGEAVRRR